MTQAFVRPPRMRLDVMARVRAIATLMLVLPACVGPGVARHPLERTDLWHSYREMKDVRALAIAGDPDGVWVGGIAAGQPSAASAEREALAECARQRARRRLQVPCVVYASGTEIKWSGRIDR